MLEIMSVLPRSKYLSGYVAVLGDTHKLHQQGWALSGWLCRACRRGRAYGYARSRLTGNALPGRA